MVNSDRVAQRNDHNGSIVVPVRIARGPTTAEGLRHDAFTQLLGRSTQDLRGSEAIFQRHAIERLGHAIATEKDMPASKFTSLIAVRSRVVLRRTSRPGTRACGPAEASQADAQRADRSV